MFIQVSAESANQFGELVADPVTKELLHYTEKPETFVCIFWKIIYRSPSEVLLPSNLYFLY